MFDHLTLTRVPQDKSLKPWSAADELLVTRYQNTLSEKTLFINDPFGVSTLLLGQTDDDLWQDSFMSIEATRLNAERNEQAEPNWISEDLISTNYNTIVIWLPKSIDYLEYLLQTACRCLSDGGKVLIPGMVKHISTGHIKLINSAFSDVNPGRAQKKARVIECRHPNRLIPQKRLGYSVDFLTNKVLGFPGCYGAKALDAGARVVLEHLNEMNIHGPTLDMGCGNGILSLALLNSAPNISITLVDEHRAALRSAKYNVQQNFPSADAQFVHSNGTNCLKDKEFDLIVCNPPFHQENTVTERISEKLFKDFSASLSHTGECWIIANRHLDYYKKLNALFTSVRTVSNNPKFVLYVCRH